MSTPNKGLRRTSLLKQKELFIQHSNTVYCALETKCFVNRLGWEEVVTWNGGREKDGGLLPRSDQQAVLPSQCGLTQPLRTGRGPWG